jgi:hypothetical protein
VGAAIVDHLFPPKTTGAASRSSASPAAGHDAAARLVAWLLHLTGRHTAWPAATACSSTSRRWRPPTAPTGLPAERVLMNRSVDAAVFENGCRDAILGDGTAYDRCQVGIVTDVDDEPAFRRVRHRQPRSSNVLRTQVDVVLPDGAAVLNAEDPQVARMAELCDGEVIFYGLARTAGHCHIARRRAAAPGLPAREPHHAGERRRRRSGGVPRPSPCWRPPAQPGVLACLLGAVAGACPGHFARHPRGVTPYVGIDPCAATERKRTRIPPAARAAGEQ